MGQDLKKTTDRLNSLLRGELAAADTYQQAIAKVGAEQGSQELQRIHLEHCEAAAALQDHVRRCGCEPAQTSGAWGTFATAVEGAAQLFGNSAALKALKEGEEQGISDYQAALQDEAVPMDCKSVIVSRLLPQTRNHVAALNRLMTIHA
jgi:uncharacterized protein (TIGR02284 family)